MQIKTNKTSPISISTQERAMKFVGLCLIAACFWPFSALAYKISCPEGWTSFSQSPSCYLLYTGKEETFNDAKEICENHDATLAIIDSVPEKDRLATLVGQVTRKHFWVGLNYIDDKWLWLDNTTVDNSIITWYNNSQNSHGCGSMVAWGQLDGKNCEEVFPFVCERSLGAPVKCGDGWERYGESCYKRYHHEKKLWDEARETCQKDNADLIVINNHFENFWLYDFAHRDEVDIWLGMRENGTEDKYVWVNGIANGGENVINDRWEDQEPKSRGGKGAAIMASSSHDKWSTRDYDGETLSFVCEKPLGDFCLFDMIDHQKFCYDFNFDPNVAKTPWTNARDGCGNLGLQMITVNTHGLDNWITKTLYNSGLFSTPSSLNGMWIGYYETDKTTSEFKLFPDNTTLSGDMYDARRDDIQYTEELDCLYTVACPGNETGDCSYGADEFHRWNSDQCENPGFNHIQGCRIPKGQPIDVSNLMHPQKFCPEGWGEPFADFCYLSVMEEMSWGKARSFCQHNHSSADLVTIFSPYENNYVKKLATDWTWIGLSDGESEGSWTWVDGTGLGEWKNWAENEPNGGSQENCVELSGSGWNDKICSTPRPFVCKMAASTDPSGNPETSTMPPTNNCGYMGNEWVENPNTGMCYTLVTDHMYTWTDAREYCKYRGGYRENGDLASIGSLDEQKYFNSWFTIVEHYTSTWIGINDLNRESSFKWSDGTPFAFMNWADTEPNGNEGENCGEMKMDDWTKGRWNDYICSEPLHFVCEKKGSNYVEPPKPPKPEPQCAEGWQRVADRCIYNSFNFGRTASNWTEAKAVCKGFHEGSTLVSIRNQEDQDSLYSLVMGITFIGGTDANHEGQWTWEDGEPFSYNHWGVNEPNGNETENCLEVDYNLNWNDVECGGQYSKYFMCSSPISLCPNSWYYFDGQCWYWSAKEEKMPWQAAQDFCRDGSKMGNLISIHDGNTNAVAAEVAENDNWIGLTINAKDDYRWVDDSSFDYSSWKDGEPDNFAKEQCGSINHESGNWSTTNCEENLGFTCRFKSTHYIACPSGWAKWNGNCYLLQPEVNAMVFQSAEDGCVNRGGHLASIESEAELGFIQSYIAGYHQCGNDWWSLDVQENKCYYYSPDKLSWFDAKSSCDESDSTLVVVDSAAKNNKMLGLAPMGTSLWTSATDQGHEGKWQWVYTNASLDCENSFCDWHAGEPSGGETENCLEIWNDYYWSNGAWNDASCNETLTHYVCEKAATTDSKKKVWIGLNDLENTGTVTWTNQDPVTFTKWAPGQPYHHPGDSLQCVLLTENNEMTLVDCSEDHLSVCKRPAEITSVPPDSYGCSEGQYEYQASCYELFHEHRTFAAAQSTCQDNGGNLISINDGDEQGRLISILAETYGSYYIGLKYSVSSNTFEWASGEYYGYSEGWDHSQPDLSGDDKEKCAMVSSEGATGYWFIGKCVEPHSFICEFPRSGYTVPPTTPTTVQPQAQCEGPEWNLNDGHCYKYFDTPMPFTTAETFCKSKGGHLLSVNSQDEDGYWFANLEIYYQYIEIWIGLRQDEVGEGGYYWTDESPFDYTNFKYGQPDDQNGRDNCIGLDFQYSYDVGWMSHNCASEMPFVCKVMAGIDPPTTAAPPTINPPVVCSEIEQDWVKPNQESEYCYKFVAADSDQDTWKSSEDQCRAEGGHLASVESQTENDFVMVNLKRAGVANAFIGLYVNNDDQFVWTDGSVYDYTSWSTGEPNGFFGLEGCATMFTGSGHWNDVYCGRPQNGFACKRKAEGIWTTPQPTQLPPGHCSSDQFEYKGFCYKFVGMDGNASLHRNWTEAQKECQKMGPNSDLVSFHSDHEQAFVTTILASHDRPDIEIYEFWIGFHDFVHWDYGDYGTFVWSDQSIVNYVNWAANEPNGVNEVEGICVEMWAHDDYDIGHWNDHYCETQLPYICKSKASMDNPEPPTVEKCSDQYSDFDKFKSGCYKWVDEPATWSEAEAKCQKMDGSHLVSILSQSEEAFALISMKSQASWTGLTDQNHLGYFKWSDGWPMQISNWGQYPSNSAQESLCVSFNATDGKWYPQSCQEKLPFLCKHSDATPPTPSPNGECPTSAFTDLDPSLEHCYHFEHDLTLAWGEANRACLAMGHGSNLVSIHSEHEMNLIAGELGKYQVVAWIGLFTTAEAGNTFFWVDNSPTDFFNWEDNEPNGQGYELCVQVYGHNGKWNDATCTPYDQNLGYVCKAPKIQIPTEIPPKSSSTTNEIPSSSSSSSPSSVSSTTQTSTRSTETTTTILIEPPDDSGMSGGVIAIVVIICLLATAGGAVFLVMFFKRESRLKKLLGFDNQLPQRNVGSFDNVGYEESANSSS